jgi:hypothetical protein
MRKRNLLALLILVAASCTEDPFYGLALDEERADDGSPSVQIISDLVLTNTADYEALNGTSLEVEVTEGEQVPEILTHDISVFEPEQYAYFATNSDDWRLSISQGLTSNIGGLVLTPTEMTECHSLETKLTIDCPLLEQTGKYTAIRIDAPNGLVHVTALNGDLQMAGTFLLDSRASNNFFRIVPVPIELESQQASVDIVACNQNDCWL